MLASIVSAIVLLSNVQYAASTAVLSVDPGNEWIRVCNFIID